MKLKGSWPGHNTWLLPDPNQSYPYRIRDKFATVAARVSAHPIVRQLCQAIDGPVVSTSANPAAKPPRLCVLEVQEHSGNSLDAIVHGEPGGQDGRSINRDLVKDTVLRS